MSNNHFNPSFLNEVLASKRLSIEGLEEAKRYYLEIYEGIGAPAPGDLTTATDLYAFSTIGAFTHAEHKTWERFRQQMVAIRQDELDSVDPYLPSYYSKTDDKPNNWTQETEGLDETQKTALSTQIKASSPQKGTLVDKLRTPPTLNKRCMEDILDVMDTVQDLFLWSFGDGDDAEWRWGACLCLLSGLGLDAVRHIARGARDLEDWAHWATASDTELADDILRAHQIHGTPCGLYRLEWRRLLPILQNATISKDGQLFKPRWVQACIALHLIKHVRYCVTTSGPSLRVTYRGTRSTFPLAREGAQMTMTSTANRANVADICKVLHLPYCGTAAKQSWLESVVFSVLSRFNPVMFARPRVLSTRYDIVCAPCVTIRRHLSPASEYRWIDAGIRVGGLASIDVKTGVVDKDFVLTGEEAAALDWPELAFDRSLFGKWLNCLPDKVEPVDPWTVIRSRVKNINDLGCPEGVAAMVNTMIFLDIFRTELLESKNCRSLANEFPLFMVLPTGHDLTDTTQQGKTIVAMAVGTCCVPGLEKPNISNKSASAPAQRAMAAPLEHLGTALYDEFVLPNNHEHFLSQAGLQGLATGARVSPGRAGENSIGVQLKHPLFFTVKVPAFPPDVINRTIPVFMDELTTDTRADGRTLMDLSDGLIGMEARLSALRFADEVGLLDQIRSLEPTIGAWRYRTHIMVSSLFADLAEVEKYLKVAATYMDEQRGLAEASGLAADIGLTEGFDPTYFWETCSDLTLEELRMKQDDLDGALGYTDPLDLLKGVIEDGGARSFDSVLRQYRVKERAAILRFTAKISKEGNEWKRRGWVLLHVPRSQSDVLDSQGRPKGYFKLIKPSET